jgi:CheY-like chemotaxis protein
VFEAVQAIRQQHAMMRVVAISEELGAEVLKLAESLGARATLPKPQEVLRAIQEAMAPAEGSAAKG